MQEIICLNNMMPLTDSWAKYNKMELFKTSFGMLDLEVY